MGERDDARRVPVRERLHAPRAGRRNHAIRGYRFGGDFFEFITGQPVDTDGAPTVGAVVDIPLGGGLQFEALFTHQKSRVTTASGPLGVPTRWTISVDHWQGGALQEYADGSVRPFATGMFGLTRYAGEGDSEMRFTMGAGGGVKLFPSSTFGVRLQWSGLRNVRVMPTPRSSGAETRPAW